MNPLVWMANILGWPVVHLTIGFVSVRLPAHLFARDNWLTAPRGFEDGGRIYRDWMGIRKWKSLLPDGAPRFGGFAKKRLLARETEYLQRFMLETRRAEIAHWCMLCLPSCFLSVEPALGMLGHDRIRVRRQSSLHTCAALQPHHAFSRDADPVSGICKSMSQPSRKLDGATRRRRYVIHLACASEAGGDHRRYVVRIRLLDISRQRYG